MKIVLTALLWLALLPAEVVTLITKENALEVLASSNLVLDVYAEWCGPCKQFSPVFEKVAKETTLKIRFAKANAEGNSGISEKFNILTIPTIIFLKEGKEIGRELGYMSAKTLTSKIERYFKEAPLPNSGLN